MDRIITSSRDRTSLLSTHKVLRNTYFMLSLTLAFSAITATASTVLMLPSPGLILTLVGMYGLMFLTYKTANKPSGIISAFAFTGFLGYILGPILNAYLSAGMGDVIGMAGAADVPVQTDHLIGGGHDQVQFVRHYQDAATPLPPQTADQLVQFILAV